MTEQKTQDAPRDVDWEKAQATIRGRILALRERQAAEKAHEGAARE